MAGTRRDVSARRARYRSARRAVLAVGLLVGIGYPLALALRGALLVQVRSAGHGTSVSIHNARPWLIVAAVAAVLLVLDVLAPGAPGRRPADPSGPGGPGRRPAGASAPDEAARPGVAPATPAMGDRSLQARIDALQAARRSEREFNVALDTQLAEMWAAPLSPADRRRLAGAVLELTMELVAASMGLLVLGHDAQGAVAARGISDPDDLVAQLADAIARHRGRTWHDRAGGEWLVLELAGEPGGYIALSGRAGGFAGLDPDALDGVAGRAAALLSGPTARPASPAG